MSFPAFSQWLGDITQPNHPYYYPIQLLLFGSMAGAGSCLTNIPPTRAIALASLIYSINQLTTPLFVKILDPYEETTLVPLVGQGLQLISSAGLAYIICRLFKRSVSCKQIMIVSGTFTITLLITKGTLYILRQEYLG